MVEVRLHGPLAAKYGRVWNLDIASPAEAVAAINANRPGFADFIMALDRQGLVFRVRSKTHDYGEEDIATRLGNVKRVDIIPIVRGASAGVRFILGAALVVAGFMIGGPAGSMQALAAQSMVAVGASLVLGSIVEWLSSVPKRDATQSLNSWTMSGSTNTVDQGLPVPIIYGEVLTGGYTISAGINASQVAPSSSIEPSVAIGGEPNVSVATGGGGFFTVVVTLSVSPFNVGEPYTYSWAMSGFAGAVARRISRQNTATVRIELDYSKGADVIFTDTGSATVTVSGKDPNGSGGNVAPSATQAVSVTLNTTVPVYNDDGRMTCFPAGALVLMGDGSECPIERVRVGDFVMGVYGAVPVTSIETPVLGSRRMLGFADGHRWSEEHAHWTRDAEGIQWWWSANKALWQAEVAAGVIGGLWDDDSMRGPEVDVEFAHVDGWKRQDYFEVPGYAPDTRLYMVVTDGGPAIVDGYVVGAGVDESAFCYSSINWKGLA